MHTHGYETLRRLCKETPGRLDGSKAAEKAVIYTYNVLKNLLPYSVHLQAVTAPYWTPGNIAQAKITSTNGDITELSICALGPSVPTANKGVTAPVIEVHSIDDLQTLGIQKIKGKIVFFNRPMDSKLINTIETYSNTMD